MIKMKTVSGLYVDAKRTRRSNAYEQPTKLTEREIILFKVDSLRLCLGATCRARSYFS